MNRVLLPVFIIVCSSHFIFPQSVPANSLPLLSDVGHGRQAASAGSGHLPPARQILEDVRTQLPQDAIVITGDLTVRKHKGVVSATLGFEMFLNMGTEPATARYTIRDAFGTELEQLTVTRRTGREPHFEYAAGSQLSVSNLPDLFKSVQDTDVSWMDLTLSFLWWPDATIVRTETIRGRSCFVVNLSARPLGHGLGKAGGQYAKVLLWIDEKLHIVLQAETYDSDERLVRRLGIKSFKKINDRWMIKDMEVESFPPIHRTRLRVREVSPPARS